MKEPPPGFRELSAPRDQGGDGAGGPEAPAGLKGPSAAVPWAGTRPQAARRPRWPPGGSSRAEPSAGMEQLGPQQPRAPRALREEALPPMGETMRGKNYADPCAVFPLLIRGRAVETCPFPTDAATPEVGRLLPNALPP